MGKIATTARRTFLLGSVAIAGGVAFGYWKYRQPFGNPLSDQDSLVEGAIALTPYVRIDANGVTIITPRAEMGQGVHTTLAALVAEELDISLDDVRIEHGPASYAYFNATILEEAVPFAPTDDSWIAETAREFMRVPAKFLALQVTGGSTSMVDGFTKMRTAGAAARHVLLQAAAQQLNIDVASLTTSNGAIVTADGRRLPYPTLASAATGIEPPSAPVLKSPSDWKILGKTQPRVDMVAKVTGIAIFGIDARPDGLLHATIRLNPHLGRAMHSFDASKAEKMAGVKKIIPLNTGVAVVATNTWYAMQAAQAISFDWEPATYPATTSAMFAAVEAGFDDAFEDSQNRNDGDVAAALTGNEIVQAEYRAPYVAHATMEPMNATAWLRDGQLDIWVGTQSPTQSRTEASKITGLSEDKIAVHTLYLGGGFGRRSEVDFVHYAVQVAKAMEGTPVKTTWSREEDMGHDTYRPMAVARCRAAVSDGIASACEIKISSASVIASQFGRINMPVAGPDSSIVQGAWEQPYEIENYQVTGYRSAEMLPIGFWRSVGASQNGFFHESFMDEMAYAAGTDPIEMRLKLLSHEPSRKVLRTVTEMANWGGKLPPGHAQGVAFVLSFGVPTAEIVEIARIGERIKLVKVYAAADVGIALDPGNLEAQLQSGINFGLGTAMMGEITVEDGQVKQSNFHDFSVLRMHQAPEIAVKILENGSKIRGIGEPGTPPAAPALGNAIFRLTGKRLREMPFNKFVDFV
ncbi:MAG: molybdopterin cofactor-binding domain-containing protein [Burkholderiaceae bacterium]